MTKKEIYCAKIYSYDDWGSLSSSFRFLYCDGSEADIIKTIFKLEQTQVAEIENLLPYSEYRTLLKHGFIKSELERDTIYFPEMEKMIDGMIEIESKRDKYVYYVVFEHGDKKLKTCEFVYCRSENEAKKLLEDMGYKLVKIISMLSEKKHKFMRYKINSDREWEDLQKHFPGAVY